jgi:DNA topoisomerase IB
MPRLRRIDCSAPGIARRRRGRGFEFVDATGARITDPESLLRIKSLGIPPAWRNVWICPDPNGHLQAVGTDAAGRRQYLYHPDFRAQQEQGKFDRLIRFAEKLPDLRAAMARHMELDDLAPDRVCAVAVRLVNLGWFRVGSEEYARRHRTFGITTLRKSHVRIRGSRLTFSYPGKRRVRVRTALVEPELAAAVRELQRLPGGRRLFRYRVDSELYNLSARRLNDYIQEHMDPDFTAKDFRTWGGTLLAAIALAEHGVPETEAEMKRTIAAVMRTVGEKLGNTPAVARASYVSPAVVEQFADGRTLDQFRPRHLRVVGARDTTLDPEEQALLSLLRSWRARRRLAEDTQAA